MKYQNPVLSGFYPDPSVCSDGSKFYLVNSTFHYFPGVTLFESDDLVNWKQIGHVLTRESQLPLEGAYRSGGIFAPTIRYNNGRFYMITTNVTGGGNFIVYTDDIYGEWSEPVWIPQQGIDPSLLFADDKCYFIGNGTDKEGRGAVFVNEIIPETGENVTEPKPVWHGCGGRYLEGPHLYKINGWYYLMAAEGGTEYGHHEIIARSRTPYGDFEASPYNPFLTNRNLGGFDIQGVGHADLIEDKDGNWWIIHLAFRQTGEYMTFHVTGRETYLVPAKFDSEGWLHAGSTVTDNDENDANVIYPKAGEDSFEKWNKEGKRCEGITEKEIVINALPEIKQELKITQTFDNTELYKEWVTLRKPLPKENLSIELRDGKRKMHLKGTECSICEHFGTPAFVAIRQKEMHGDLECIMETVSGAAGLSVYMDDRHHYDIMVKDNKLALRLRIGDAESVREITDVAGGKPISIGVSILKTEYVLSVETGGKIYPLGNVENRYLSSEVAGGFVGVMLGLFVEPGGEAYFYDFKLEQERG